ncbi:C-type lectin lectoxin-Lio3-like, partial [Physella acuta]|uniref:C-type lectin lectoxin-Lio3-like n=1 Tax=Physella acuta TaxID=109671 RepID=UPI0027DACF48
MNTLAALVLLFTISYAQDCGPGWVLRADTNFCYRFETSTFKNWTNARDACESFGGNLVTISSADEQAYLTGQLSNLTTEIWIGLSDDLREGAWRWADRSCVTYTNWSPAIGIWGVIAPPCCHMPSTNIDGTTTGATTTIRLSAVKDW